MDDRNFNSMTIDECVKNSLELSADELSKKVKNSTPEKVSAIIGILNDGDEGHKKIRSIIFELNSPGLLEAVGKSLNLNQTLKTFDFCSRTTMETSSPSSWNAS